MNIDDFLKDSIFFAEELEYLRLEEEICQEELDELDDFPGKEVFLRFYSAHNGMEFALSAWFFPEEYYSVSIGLGSNPYVEIEGFYPISYIDKERDIITINRGYDEDFLLFHIPFAWDVRGNPFWIDIQSGEIKYTDFDTYFAPEAVTVAFSFESFCRCIRKNESGMTAEELCKWFNR